MHVSIDRKTVRRRGQTARSAPNGAAKAYERIGDRAWRLAGWLTGDDELATAAVVRAFADHGRMPEAAWGDDAKLLSAVRTCALAGHDIPPLAAATTRAQCAAMPAAQREVVELAFVAGLDVEAIARVTTRPVGEVRAHLLRGGRALAGSVSHGCV